MNFFKNLKLSQKIGLLSASFYVFFIIIGVIAITQMNNANSKLKDLNNSRMTPIIELENVKSDIEYIRTQSSLIMDETDSTTIATYKSNITKEIAIIDKVLAKYKNDSEFKTVFTDYKSFLSAKDSFITAMADRTANKNAAGAQSTAAGSAATSTTNKTQGGPPSDISNFDKTKTALTSALDKIINKQVSAANKSYTDSEATYKITIAGFAVVLAVCIAISIVLTIVIIRSIVIPVKKVTGKLKEISASNGDLTQRIGYESKDEIGKLSGSFDLFMEKLQSIIEEVTLSANTIADSSEDLNRATSNSSQSLEQISSTVVEIASGTSDAAASAEETTASLGEAAKFSESTAAATKNTADNSKKAKKIAEEGASKINEIVTSINEIDSSSKEVSRLINDLGASSEKIGDIIKIITSISEQTNLLALNAAIEAARAGEAGKGFNVVADEIRKLADESNTAAREISELIKENQLKADSAVNSVNQVEEKVALGVTKASEVGESIQKIITNIQNVVSEIERIDDANEQQAQSTKDIEKAISSIAVTSNEIAGGTENISASIEEQLSTMLEIEKSTGKVSEMAKKLSEITAGFTV